MPLSEYTYVFAIGTFFALLEAYNNGASKYLISLKNPEYCREGRSLTYRLQTMSRTRGRRACRLAPSPTAKPWFCVWCSK